MLSFKFQMGPLCHESHSLKVIPSQPIRARQVASKYCFVLISNLKKSNAHYSLTEWRFVILTICCFCSSKSFHFLIFLGFFSTWKPNKKDLFKKDRLQMNFSSTAGEKGPQWHCVKSENCITQLRNSIAICV